MKKLIPALFISMAFIACDKDDDDNNGIAPDTTPPVVTLTEPHDDESIARGTDLHVEGEITDDRGLAQMKIDIHYAGDGHGHGGKTSMEFEYEAVITISGTKWQFHEDIAIPNEADTGKHHLIIYALDAAGNQAQFVEKDFYVTE